MANVDPILYRTPILDASGRVTREWIRFFSELSTAAGVTQNVQNTTILQGQASAFDDVPQHDIGSEIRHALLATGESPLPAPVEAVPEFAPPPPLPVDPATLLNADSLPPAPADPLGVLALLDVADPAGAANALLASANSWTNTQTVQNDIRVTPATGSGMLRLVSSGGINFLQSGAAFAGGSTADFYLTPMASGTPYLAVKAGGNVLIGTSVDNATDKVQIAGSINATSYRVGGTAGASGTFKSADATPKTITVTNGIITSIV